MPKPETRTWIDDLHRTSCQACAKPMVFARNRASGKDGPVDLKATLYVIHQPAMPMAAIECNTWNDFLAGVQEIVMLDGRRIRPSEIAVGVSHFSTCTRPGQFSRANRR